MMSLMMQHNDVIIKDGVINFINFIILIIALFELCGLSTALYNYDLKSHIVYLKQLKQIVI